MEGELPVEVMVMVGNKRSGIGMPDYVIFIEWHAPATLSFWGLCHSAYGSHYTKKRIDLGARKGVVAIPLSYMAGA